MENDGPTAGARFRGLLRRELDILQVFSIAAGAMISSGLFVLPGLLFLQVGPAACFAYLLAGVLVVPAMFCKAELVTAMPRAGGAYFFIDRSLGAAFGTLAGVASWLSLSLKTAFALFGAGAVCMVLRPGLSMWAVKAVAVACCLALTALNIKGVRHAGRLQSALVVSLLVILLVYVVRGLTVMRPANFEHFTQPGWSQMFGATGMVFVSYGGLTKVASMAEEVKNPGRNLPLGMFLAFGVVTALYFFAVMATVGVIGDRVGGNLNSLVDGARACLGIAGVVALSLAALMAYVTTGNAGIMAASRVPLAMSRDHLLPSRLAAIDAKRGTPTRAILGTSLFMVLAILFLDLETLVKVASTMKILLFTLVILAVILMRESRIENYRPEFKVPGYPYVPVAGIVAYLFLLSRMGMVPLALSAAFVFGGLLWYGFYGRIRVNRESALIRITQRIVPTDLSGVGLETELREILRERDGLIEDAFDRIIQDCPILDLKEEIEQDAFFGACAKALAQRLKLREEEVDRLLHEREEQSSTVLKPGLAIPHILIPGERQFHVVLVRSREGIRMPDADEPVHAAFILAGTEDLRNYHLRVLMFIAQITQAADFEERWMRAARTEDLRNIVLLAKRTRQPDDADIDLLLP
ncbi:amino acid permease [Verrucomicrobiota bacterium]